MNNPDTLLRFSFEQLDIRGELVYLDQSWKTILDRYPYPPKVRKQLGDALAAVAILSATVKFEGSMILQIQSTGPITTLVTQANSNGEIRGLAKWKETVPEGTLKEVFGKGQIIITIVQPSGERYQSIVALEGENLSSALQGYFEQSEQLRSSFFLFVSDSQVAGLFLQTLPPSTANEEVQESENISQGKEAEELAEENWNRINFMADTLSKKEIFTLDAELLLSRLFHQEQLSLYAPKALEFTCGCSEEKVRRTLVAMGKEDLLNILQKESAIKVDCEFCNMHYEYGPKEIDQIFIDSELTGKDSILH